MIVSDALHILKRARDRVLGIDVHLPVTNNSEILNSSILRDVLSLPTKTFSNQLFTKMHDDLAASMFSLLTLVTLCKQTMVPYFA